MLMVSVLKQKGILILCYANLLNPDGQEFDLKIVFFRLDGRVHQLRTILNYNYTINNDYNNKDNNSNYNNNNDNNSNNNKNNNCNDNDNNNSKKKNKKKIKKKNCSGSKNSNI